VSDADNRDKRDADESTVRVTYLAERARAAAEDEERRESLVAEPFMLLDLALRRLKARGAEDGEQDEVKELVLRTLESTRESLVEIRDTGQAGVSQRRPSDDSESAR
jgi:hypothetical protein